MGQEASSLVSEDTRPSTLSDRSISAVAELIKSGRVKRIVVMTGAGISTAAGIPDFRSPDTGLYHNLARLNLPHPEAVFEVDFFRNDPRPFYVLAKELYPGNFQPTISHAFMALLAKKKLLRMLFTQNIDCLERAAGVPPELIVEAHGSFATQRCIDCKTEFPDAEMRRHVELGDPPTCIREGCGGLVKPDIVFFGEQLPSAFFNNATVPQEADLVIVVGTSLMVHPFAGLPRLARGGVPRLLFNMDIVGDLGTRADDVLCLGECDAGIRRLADELGWRDELESLWVDTVGEKEAERQRLKKRGENMQQELDELVQGIEKKLELSEDHGNHDSNTNAKARAEQEGEKQEETREALPTELTDGAQLAPEKEIPTWYPEGSIEESARYGRTSPGEQKEEVLEKSTKANREGLEVGAVASYTPVQTADAAATTTEKSEAKNDGKDTKPTL
ncbi:DHS-like NAD/FAD-binding domain-containing protein [Xylariaceae sp. FL1651]|nr:DHS-like NAD/FAD-binding domain-containing protein [Xylariaceae sp. FL1651]